MIKELWSAIETEMKALGFVYGTEEKDRRFTIGIGPVVSDQEVRGTIGGGKIRGVRTLSVSVFYLEHKNDPLQILHCAEEQEKIIAAIHGKLNLFYQSGQMVKRDEGKLIEGIVSFTCRDDVKGA
jgi:hypothetical protein